jgi:hypothetical protein
MLQLQQAFKQFIPKSTPKKLAGYQKISYFHGNGVA